MNEEAPESSGDLEARPFALLSDETRRSIVEESAELAVDLEGPTFSELRRHAGVTDPGRFRYHLDKLLGTLLNRESGGYVPRYGTLKRAVGLNSCRPTDRKLLDAVPTQIECPHCDRFVAASYGETEYFTLHCPEHSVVFSQELPPSLDSRDPTAWVDLAIQTMHASIEWAAMGLCPWCRSEVTSALRSGWFTYDPRVKVPADTTSLWVQHRCTDCVYNGWYPAEVQATTDADVRAFFLDHGVDVRTCPFPQRHLQITVVDEDEEGIRGARLEYTVDGDQIEVSLDQSSSVVEVDPPGT